MKEEKIVLWVLRVLHLQSRPLAYSASKEGPLSGVIEDREAFDTIHPT